MSTLYGSDALGGVINIITKDTTNETHGSISVDHTFETQTNRGDTTRTSYNFSGPLVKDKLGFQLSGNYLHRLNSTDANGNTADGANITPSGAKNYNFNALTQTSVTIEAGYHNGSGKVNLTADLENALAAI